MATEVQFQVVTRLHLSSYHVSLGLQMTAAPEHEKKFLRWRDRGEGDLAGPQNNSPSFCVHAARREKCMAGNRGTYFAFHGSPVSNWHSIIRLARLSFVKI